MILTEEPTGWRAWVQKEKKLRDPGIPSAQAEIRVWHHAGPGRVKLVHITHKQHNSPYHSAQASLTKLGWSMQQRPPNP